MHRLGNQKLPSLSILVPTGFELEEQLIPSLFQFLISLLVEERHQPAQDTKMEYFLGEKAVRWVLQIFHLCMGNLCTVLLVGGLSKASLRKAWPVVLHCRSIISPKGWVGKWHVYFFAFNIHYLLSGNVFFRPLKPCRFAVSVKKAILYQPYHLLHVIWVSKNWKFSVLIPKWLGLCHLLPFEQYTV